jgi:hypothetical protein
MTELNGQDSVAINGGLVGAFVSLVSSFLSAPESLSETAKVIDAPVPVTDDGKPK